MDFLAAGVTSNSRESFSYTPRSRQLYATLDEDDWGFHLLGGQAWSLLTTNTEGIIPRKEQIPLTIDAQYVVGFNWLRVPQFRVVENFGSDIWVGVSAESPQIVTSPITAPSTGVNYTNPGNAAGLLNNQTSYSNDYVPDFVAKLAVDPGWGHYEAKALMRTFTLRAGGAIRTRSEVAEVAQQRCPSSQSISIYSSVVWWVQVSAATAPASFPMPHSPRASRRWIQ